MHQDLFGTPLFVFDIPGIEPMLAELGRRLSAEAESSPGLKVSNRGSWHSVPDLSLRKDPVFQALSAMLVDHFRYATEYTAKKNGTPEVPAFGMFLTTWAMVMGQGSYTVLHDHPESTWSSAFVVAEGDPAPDSAPDSGKLVFVDPRRATSAVAGLALHPSEFAVTPKTGRLVIFPGYLQHYVHAYAGQRPRITIASNASIRVKDSEPRNP